MGFLDRFKQAEEDVEGLEAFDEEVVEDDKPQIEYVDYSDGILSDSSGTIGENEFLQSVKPRAGYVFHSDYFQVDNYYAKVMSFFHLRGAKDNYGAFWGVNRIPVGLPKGVTTVNFEQVKRMGEGWVRDHQQTTENVLDTSGAEVARGVANNSSVSKLSRSQADLVTIAEELNDGASYLSVCNRIIVKAPTLAALDDACNRLERFYMDRFASMHAAPYIGAQREEMSRLFADNAAKRGKPFYFTSTEFAGSYSLVTHGMEDPGGEYVGYMIGDVNTSAVVMDVDDYKDRVVVANAGVNEYRNRARNSDMWASKISQAALLNGHRVVHIILNGANMDDLGPKFAASTWRVDMSHGDVNMFEMFGKPEDELSIFATQMQKLRLMAEQAYESNDQDKAIIRGSLEDIATKFYIDEGMWRENAQMHRDRLRVVGIPHNQVPRLEKFVTYLDMEYSAMVHATARDPEKVHALNVLSMTFKNLLSNDGDLFNTTTANAIDGASAGRRVIYDFGGLRRRGKGIAMAQLVNVFGFAVGNLGYRDVVIIHGADQIDPAVREYIQDQLDTLHEKGGRIALCYSSVEDMIADADFNRFDEADWTCLGSMAPKTMDAYQERLGHVIPGDLRSLITSKSSDTCYVRRGYDNVVFRQDLLLDAGGEFKNGARGSTRKSTWLDKIKAKFERRG